MKKCIALAGALLLSFSSLQAKNTRDLINDVLKFAPEAVEYAVLFSIDCFSGNDKSGKIYLENNSGTYSKSVVKKIAYYLRLEQTDGTIRQVFVTVDPFLEKTMDYGFPRFWPRFPPIQEKVTGLTVKSDVPNVKNGAFSEGNVEIWLQAVSPKNTVKVPGASDTVFDIGDSPVPGHYGVFQIHNTKEKQTVFSVNHWAPGKNVETDIGIGNAPSGNPDWSFSKAGKYYKSAYMLILIKIK